MHQHDLLRHALGLSITFVLLVLFSVSPAENESYSFLFFLETHLMLAAQQLFKVRQRVLSRMHDFYHEALCMDSSPFVGKMLFELVSWS